MSRAGGSPRARLLVLVTVALASCGPPTPSGLPADLFVAGAEGTLTIHTDPFRLSFPAAHGFAHAMVTAQPALSAGIVARPDPGHLYDPVFGDDVAQETSTKVLSVTHLSGNALRLTVGSTGSHHFLVTVSPEAVAGGRGDHAVTVEVTPARDVVQARIAFATHGGERFYGLGEWFDGFEQHGRVRDLRFDLSSATDAGQNQMHVKAPTYVSTAGYGVLLDDPGPLVADMGSTGPVTLTVVGTSIHAHLVTAPTPVDIEATIQTIAGRPPLWPKWVFAPQQWRNEDPVTCTVACAAGCNASSTGSDVVLGDAHAMRDLDLPGSVIWLDAPWETGFNTFVPNPLQFPDAKGLVDSLHALGYQVIVWASPFMDAADDSATECGMEGANAGGVFAEAKAAGYLVTGANGKPLLFPWRSTTGALVDFTNPDAVAWWQGLLSRVVSLGVRGFKLDFDEYVVPSLGPLAFDDYYHFHDGSTANEMSSRYSALYHQAAEGALRSAGTPGFIIARTGSAFDAPYATAVWPGDLCDGFQRHGEADAPGGKPHAGGLPAAMNAMVSLAASAHPFFGSDVGGYKHGPPTDEALARWIELGALSPVMELGGGGTDHDPWDASLYDPSLVPIYRAYAKLHIDLFPYLYAYAKRASVDGTPLVRAPGMAFPDDASMRDTTDAYFFGAGLYVAPVMRSGARTRTLAVPPGRWTSFWTDATYDGPKTVTVDAPLDRIPILVRAGAVIPMLPEDVDTLAPATDPSVVTLADRADRMRLRVYPGPKRAILLADDTAIAQAWDGTALTVTISEPAARTWSLRVAWTNGAAAPTTVGLDDGRTLAFAATRADYDTGGDAAYYDAAAGVLWVRFDAPASGITMRAE